MIVSNLGSNDMFLVKVRYHIVPSSTSTCVKSSGLVESRLDAAFPLGLHATWQYNWKSIRSTTLFGCCVSIGVRCKMSPSLEDKLWSVSSTPLGTWGVSTWGVGTWLHGTRAALATGSKRLAWHSRQPHHVSFSDLFHMKVINAQLLKSKASRAACCIYV